MADFLKVGENRFVNLDLVAEMEYDAEADVTSYRIIGESVWKTCQGDPFKEVDDNYVCRWQKNP